MLVYALHDDFEVSQYNFFPKPLYHSYWSAVDVNLTNS